MTKKDLCETIVETVDNMSFIGENKDDQIKAIMDLVSTLEPKDFKSFAKWGQPNQQTTPDKCWK